MLKRTVRNLAVTGITIVSATILTALSATGASATTTAAANPGHATMAANTVAPATPAAATAAAAPAASAATTGFEIVNHDGLCLGMAGDDAPAVQWTCTFASNQTWHQVTVSPGHVELRNGLNQCLSIAGSSKSRGARVYGWRCKGTPDQYWIWDTTPNYGLSIENDNSHLVLGVAGGSTKVGAAVVQWPFQDPPRGANQAWNFE